MYKLDHGGGGGGGGGQGGKRGRGAAGRRRVWRELWTSDSHIWGGGATHSSTTRSPCGARSKRSVEPIAVRRRRNRAFILLSFSSNMEREMEDQKTGRKNKGCFHPQCEIIEILILFGFDGSTRNSYSSHFLLSPTMEGYVQKGRK